MRRRIRHKDSRARWCASALAAWLVCSLLSPSPLLADESDPAAQRADRVAELNGRLAEQGSSCRMLSELPERHRIAARCQRDEPIARAFEAPELCRDLDALGISDIHLGTPSSQAACHTATCDCQPTADTPDWAQPAAGHRLALADALNDHWGAVDCRAVASDDDEAAEITLTCLDLTVTDTIERFVSATAACPTWQAVGVDNVLVTALDGVAACEVDADCRCAAELASGASLTRDQQRTLLTRIGRVERLLARGAPHDALAASGRLLAHIEALVAGDGPLVALALAAAARTALALGDAATALALHERAADSVAAGLGDNHPTTHRAACALASAQLAAGHPAVAAVTAADASAALEQRVGADHIAALRCRLTAARSELELGRDALAELTALADAIGAHPFAAARDTLDVVVALAHAELAVGHTREARARLDAHRLPATATSAEHATLLVERALAAWHDADPDAALDALLAAADRVGPQDTTVLQVVVHDLRLLAGTTGATHADAQRVADALSELVERLEPTPVTTATIELAAARWALADDRAEHALGLVERAVATLAERGLDHTPEGLDAAHIAAHALLRLGDPAAAAALLADATHATGDLQALVLTHAPRPVRQRQAAALAAIARLATLIALAAPEDHAAVALATHAALAWSDLPRRVDDHAPDAAAERTRLAARLQPAGADLVAASRERRDAIVAALEALGAEPSEAARSRHQPEVVDAVRDVLAPATALLIVRRAQGRDLALVVRTTGLAAVDLGPAGTLDAIRDQFTALAAGQACAGRPAFDAASRALHEALIAPVLPALDGVDHLLLNAPDTLDGVPPAAALAPDDRRLVETAAVTRLDRVETLLAPDSARDLPAPAPRCGTAIDDDDARSALALQWLVPRVEAELSPGAAPGAQRASVDLAWRVRDGVATSTCEQVAAHDVDRMASAAMPRLLARRAGAEALVDRQLAAMRGSQDAAAALRQTQLGALATDACGWPWLELAGDWRVSGGPGDAPGEVVPGPRGCGCAVVGGESRAGVVWLASVLLLLAIFGRRTTRRTGRS